MPACRGKRWAGFCAVTRYGRVLRINGLLLHCRLPQARMGDLCRVQAAGNTWILAEIIGCDQQDATLSALASLEGISAGAAVESLAAVHQVRVGNDLLVLAVVGALVLGLSLPLYNRHTAQNFNPLAATAGKITVVEVEEIVEPGELDPAQIHTPGIYVDRIKSAQ